MSKQRPWKTYRWRAKSETKKETNKKKESAELINICKDIPFTDFVRLLQIFGYNLALAPKTKPRNKNATKEK